MAVETYVVPSDRVVHETKVDFTRRNVEKALHVVQYDKSLPVIAVHLYKDGFTYTLPANADVKIRWGKRDHTFIYKSVLGCDSNRQIVYFDVDEQMTYFNGPCNPILELIVSGNKAGSSSIPFEIDRNPVQNSDIESHSEYPDLERAVERAEEAVERAEAAVEKAEDAEAWAVGEIDGEPVPEEAPQYHNNSKYYAEEAGDSATAASSSETNAATSASNAASSATDAAASAASAAQDAEDAHTYEQKIENMQVEAQVLPVNSNPTVTKEDVLTYFKLKFGMPVPKQITGVAKVDTHDEVDTYRISFNDNTHFDFTVTNAEISGAVLSVNGRQGNVTGLAEDDGYYAKMGVGYADNLVSTRGVEDTPENDPEYNPFTHRTTAGDQDVSNGNAEVISMRGKTFTKNQLVVNSISRSGPGINITTLGNHKFRVSGTATLSTIFSHRISNDEKSPMILGHKYLKLGFLAKSYNGGNVVTTVYYHFENNGSGNNFDVLTVSQSNQMMIYTASKNGGDFEIGFAITNGQSYDCIIEPIIVDLTLLDQALANTTGLTPAMVLAKYPNILTWDYDPGSIVNVKPNGIKTIGFNQWDEQWELGSINGSGQNEASSTQIRSKNYIPVFGGTSYYFKITTGTIGRICYYDINRNFLSVSYVAGLINIPNGACYMRFVMNGITTYNNDICINISWSGYRNGEYEPYKEEFRPIAVKTYFPDGMNGIGNVYDELYKNRYIKRFGVVDLGNITDWSYTSNGRFEGTLTSANKPLAKKIDQNTVANILCEGYVAIQYYGMANNNDKVIAVYTDGNYIEVVNKSYDGSTLNQFKQSLNGVYLVYELATPVETPISPELNMLYYAEDFGTEEWTYDLNDEPVSVPCVLKYLGNLVDKLENLNPFTDEEHASLLALLKGGN